MEKHVTVRTITNDQAITIFNTDIKMVERE